MYQFTENHWKNLQLSNVNRTQLHRSQALQTLWFYRWSERSEVLRSTSLDMYWIFYIIWFLHNYEVMKSLIFLESWQMILFILWFSVMFQHSLIKSFRHVFLLIICNKLSTVIFYLVIIFMLWILVIIKETEVGQWNRLS